MNLYKIIFSYRYNVGVSRITLEEMVWAKTESAAVLFIEESGIMMDVKVESVTEVEACWFKQI